MAMLNNQRVPKFSVIFEAPMAGQSHHLEAVVVSRLASGQPTICELENHHLTNREDSRN